MGKQKITVPCEVGDKAWIIDKDYAAVSQKLKIYKAKWTRITLVQCKNAKLFELHGEATYKIYDFYKNDGKTTMPHAMYVGQAKTKNRRGCFFIKERCKTSFC